MAAPEPLDPLHHPDNYISTTDWYTLLQDHGVERDLDPKVKRKRGMYAGPDDRYYQGIWALGNALLKLYRKRKDQLFPNFPTNDSQVCPKLCQWLFESRYLKNKSDIMETSVKDILKDVDGDELYLLDQSSFLSRSIASWGEKKQNDSLGVTVNDRIRVFGIMHLECFRDDVNQLAAGSHSGREKLDNPDNRNSATYNRISKAFNSDDEEFYIHPPPGSENLVGIGELDANDPIRMGIERNGVFIKNTIQSSMVFYTNAMNKWQLGTGGGSGADENYANWEEREDHLFENYDLQRGHWLAWIFMKDKSIGFPFNAKNQPLPRNIAIEDSIQNRNKKRRKNSRDNFMSPMTSPENSFACYITESTTAISSALSDMAAARRNSRPLPDTIASSDYKDTFDAISQAQNMKEQIHNSDLTEDMQKK